VNTPIDGGDRGGGGSGGSSGGGGSPDGGCGGGARGSHTPPPLPPPGTAPRPPFYVHRGFHLRIYTRGTRGTGTTTPSRATWSPSGGSQAPPSGAAARGSDFYGPAYVSCRRDRERGGEDAYFFSLTFLVQKDGWGGGGPPSPNPLNHTTWRVWGDSVDRVRSPNSPYGRPRPRP